MTTPDRMREVISRAMAQQPQPEGERKLVFERASTIKPRPVRWMWDTAAPGSPPQLREGRFPIGSLIIAVGRAGVGKSQFAAWTSARITTGTLPGEFYGTPRCVVYAATEDSWEMTIVPRLMAAGADLDRVFRVSVTDDNDLHARLTLPSDIGLLKKGVVEHDVALVVMDPLLSLIDSSINDYRAREVREALEPLVAVADRTKVVLLGLAHFTKAAGNDPLMLVSGSAAFGQLVRAAVAFARDDEDQADEGEEAQRPVEQRFVCSTIKNNLGREDLPSLAYRIEPHPIETSEGEAWVSRLQFTGETAARSVRDLLRGGGAPVDPEEQTERQTAAKWLRDYLTATDKAPSAEVKKAAVKAGFSERTLARARALLRVDVSDSGYPRTSYWSLPAINPVVPPRHGTTGRGTTGATVSDLQERRNLNGKSAQSCHTHVHGTTGTTGDGAPAGSEKATTNGDLPADRWRVSGKPVTDRQPVGEAAQPSQNGKPDTPSDPAPDHQTPRPAGDLAGDSPF